MKGQTNLSDVENEQKKKDELDEAFSRWMYMPEEILIPEESELRPQIREILREALGIVWKQATHRCKETPAGKDIWLNEIEAPEYWVMNDEGDPCGEHIEKCPFCGADLSRGCGDVVMTKADDTYWKITGYIQGGKERG